MLSHEISSWSRNVSSCGNGHELMLKLFVLFCFWFCFLFVCLWCWRLNLGPMNTKHMLFYKLHPQQTSQDFKWKKIKHIFYVMKSKFMIKFWERMGYILYDDGSSNMSLWFWLRSVFKLPTLKEIFIFWQK